MCGDRRTRLRPRARFTRRRDRVLEVEDEAGSPWEATCPEGGDLVDLPLVAARDEQQ
jgi:hypothetical protein